MPLLLDKDMRDFREMNNKELRDLDEWEKSRVIKRCKECGRAYSYPKGDIDPKECPSCRGL